MLAKRLKAKRNLANYIIKFSDKNALYRTIVYRMSLAILNYYEEDLLEEEKEELTEKLRDEINSVVYKFLEKNGML